ncbi:hypothetical protein G5I_08109 [Acromyrmex echinatior]|uniref:DUF4817 domain-containing protein n=1 Tax=Acromyrmex echinatior TaxID=103372 RepID=F4WQL9_ACREC|nr:hypothetical protein G5I_08109 [Acromyrmex echinatior]
MEHDLIEQAAQLNTREEYIACEQRCDEFIESLEEQSHTKRPRLSICNRQSVITWWAIYWYVFEFRRMATPNELQTRNFDSLLVIPSAARNNMFSLEERFEILKTYFQSQCCVAETVRILKRNMGRDRAPTEGAIRKLVRKVREKGICLHYFSSNTKLEIHSEDCGIRLPRTTSG